MSGTVSGVITNEQPWAASLSDVFVLQARVQGHSYATRTDVEVLIDPFFDPPPYPAC